MPLSVLTAVTDAGWEAELVADLGAAEHDVEVVRRCVDVADLLAAAATGIAGAVVLSADLRRLDREVVTRIAAAGLGVVGVIEPGDDRSEQHLQRIGVGRILPVDAGAARVAAALRDAVTGRASHAAPHQPHQGIADPLDALPRLPERADAAAEEFPGASPPDGRLIAVWGPTGAPGRTTVALGLADEAARLGVPTVLVDADAYGGVIAQAVGILDEAPGLAGAARLQAAGTLDGAALAGLCRTVASGLRVLTGITRADRWPELRADAVTDVLAECRHIADLVVVDCGFALEQDEELSYDTFAPRRNGATVAALDAADLVVAVGAADPIGMNRLIRGLGELRELRGDRPVRVVANRVRRGVTPGDPRREIAAVLNRHAGIRDPILLPYDREAADRALGSGRTLGEAAASAPLRKALVSLAAELAGLPAGRHRRRRPS